MRICSPSVPRLKHEWNHTVGLIINLRCGTAAGGVRRGVIVRTKVRGRQRRLSLGRHKVPHVTSYRSIKEEVKKKHQSTGRSFFCFAAHLIEQDLF